MTEFPTHRDWQNHPTSVAKNLSALGRDLHVVDQKIANLTVAIEDGAAVAPLVRS